LGGKAPTSNALRHGAAAAFAGAGADQLALELGEAAQDGQNQATVRRGGFPPCVGKRTESSGLVADRREGVEQVGRRLRVPAEPRHHPNVVGLKPHSARRSFARPARKPCMNQTG
jgi:hypothetical protein